MEQQPTILCVDLAKDLGGGQVSLMTMLLHLRNCGWRCIVYTPKGSALEQRAALCGLDIVQARASERFSGLVTKQLRRRPDLVLFSVLSMLAEMIRLQHVVRKCQPSIIHSNSLKAALVTNIVALFNQVPHVWHDRTQHVNLLHRLAAKGASKVVAVSTWVAGKHRGLRKVQVVYNGVNTEEFSEANHGQAVRAQLGISPTDFVVGAVSRLTPWKGLEVVLRAMALTPLRNHDTVKLVIVGDEQIERGTGERERLNALAAELGIQNKVVFAGFRTDIPDCMASFDLVVVPSIEPEPFGRVAIEAMAAGKPVIASEIGGLSEIIDSPTTGILVPPGNAMRLAEAISRLVDNPSLCREIGFGARAAVRKRFSAERHGVGMDKLLRSLLIRKI